VSTNISVKITGIDYTSPSESMPVTTILIKSEDVTTVQELEGLFRAIAQAAGFGYIESVRCHSSSSPAKEESNED
jgi:hypothetical protein